MKKLRKFQYWAKKIAYKKRVYSILTDRKTSNSDDPASINPFFNKQKYLLYSLSEASPSKLHTASIPLVSTKGDVPSQDISIFHTSFAVIQEAMKHVEYGSKSNVFTFGLLEHES